MKYIIKNIALVLVAFLVFSCGPSKAYIDTTMADGIIWPGPPEKPRIKYLWSLQRISGGAGETRFERFLGGELDIDLSDPRNSDMVINPHGLFVDGNERLYIADPLAARVNVIDLKSSDSFYFFDAGGTELVSPIGVAADAEGRIYVTDPDMKKVAVFNERGKFLYFFKGAFERPTGIAIDTQRKTVYVSDTWSHKVYIYGYDGTRTGSFGQRGEEAGNLNFPTHLAVGRDGLIHVSDTMNFRVQIFDPSGRPTGSFGLPGDSFDAFDKIKGIATDTEGNIYIVDSKQDTVRIYNRKGQLLLFFGQQGRFYGDFSLPTGIYVDVKNRIFVSDSLNMRVQAFQLIQGK